MNSFLCQFDQSTQEGGWESEKFAICTPCIFSDQGTPQSLAAHTGLSVKDRIKARLLPNPSWTSCSSRAAFALDELYSWLGGGALRENLTTGITGPCW